MTMFQNDLLAGKRILVTGGGTGLGAAMARRFAELGANLVLTSRRADVLEPSLIHLLRCRRTFALKSRVVGVGSTIERIITNT